MGREILVVAAVLAGAAGGFALARMMSPSTETAEFSVPTADRPRPQDVARIERLEEELRLLQEQAVERQLERPSPEHGAPSEEPRLEAPSATPADAPAAAPPRPAWALAPFLERLRDEEPARYAELVVQDPATLEALDLRGLQLNHEDLRWLGTLPALHSLNLRGSSIQDDDLALLQHLPLRSLELRSTELTGAGLGHLPRARLEALHLTHTKVHGRDLHSLPDLPELAVIKLNDLNVGDADLEALGRFPRLRHVELDGTPISLDGLRRFIEAHPALQRIEARRTAIGPDEWRALRALYPDLDLAVDSSAWSGPSPRGG